MKYKKPQSITKSNLSILSSSAYPSITSTLLAAAKRVDVIDGYAEELSIDKFDLVIDWGFLYFITKPLFYGIDYFFKLLGNYGLAIIAITICIRLANLMQIVIAIIASP